MEWLALSGAFDVFSPNRRELLWSLPALCVGQRRERRSGGRVAATGQQAMPIEVPPLLPANLPDFGLQQRMSWQWLAIGFCSDAHPMTLLRPQMEAAGILPCAALQEAQEGQEVMVAGLVLRPHRPPMISGEVFVFFTLEDETGMAQVTVTPDVYEQTGQDIFGQIILAVRGVAERRGVGLILRATGTQRFS